MLRFHREDNDVRALDHCEVVGVRGNTVGLGKHSPAFSHGFPEANLVRLGDTRVENPAEYRLRHDAAADKRDLH